MQHRRDSRRRVVLAIEVYIIYVMMQTDAPRCAPKSPAVFCKPHFWALTKLCQPRSAEAVTHDQAQVVMAIAALPLSYTICAHMAQQSGARGHEKLGPSRKDKSQT